jgi:hypothetical protein
MKDKENIHPLSFILSPYETPLLLLPSRPYSRS